MKASNWPGQAIGGTMNSTVRDMARMGELILQRGRYDGRQLHRRGLRLQADAPGVRGQQHRLRLPDVLERRPELGLLDRARTTPSARRTRAGRRIRTGRSSRRPTRTAGSPASSSTTSASCGPTGAGGQRIVIHRGLDMVLAVRDDAVSVNESETVGAFEGHKNVWNAIRPALVALDPVYKGDEEAFCAAYQRSEYAPDLREPWFAPPVGDAVPPAPRLAAARVRPRRRVLRGAGFDAFAVRPAGARPGPADRAARSRPPVHVLAAARGARAPDPVRARAHAGASSAATPSTCAPGRSRDGCYVAHVAMRLADGTTDVRRVVLRRARGRFPCARTRACAARAG